MPLSSRTRPCRCLLPTPSSLTSTASPRPSLYWALRPATVARDETYLHTESDDMSKLVWQGRIVIMVAQKRCRHPELSPHLSRHAISPDDRLQSMTTFLPYHLAYLLLIQICPDQFVFLDSQSPSRPLSQHQSITMARLSGLQREILSLYRKCLRETRKKPAVRLYERLEETSF
jgi:hypothetical protein